MPGRGIVWERVCTNSRDRLHQDGRLSWLPMHPPVLKIGAGMKSRRGSFLAVRTGKGPPDWVALAGSLSILGDDKSSKSMRWQLSNVHKHQATAFDKWESQGGVACILLRHHDQSRWVIPWQNMKEEWEVRTSYKLEDMERVGFPWAKPFDNEPNYDWLTPLLKWRNNESCQEEASSAAQD